MPATTEKSALATERRARGLTQEQLAGLLGIARSTLSSVENGYVRSWPRLEADAARILGVSSEALFPPSLGGNRQ